MSADVVSFRNGAGAMNIVERLRSIANEIESGEIPMPEVVIVLVEFNTNEKPCLQQFGVARPTPHLVGLFAQAIKDLMR